MSLRNKQQILCLCATLLLVLSCRNTYRAYASCPIENFLFDAENLPGSEWEEVGSRSYRDAPYKIGIARIGILFSTPTAGIVIQDVYRFGNIKDAEEGYRELSNYWFRLEPEGTSWKKLEIPDEVLINPDEYRLECSIRPNNSVRSCWYTARYEKDVILLKGNMIMINESDLFHVMELLDEKANKCISTKK